jgi:hypothetical protein
LGDLVALCYKRRDDQLLAQPVDVAELVHLVEEVFAGPRVAESGRVALAADADEALRPAGFG